MLPVEALAAIPDATPQHYETFPRVGSVWTVDQVTCLQRAKTLIEAAISECAVGQIEGDWLSGAIDNLDLSIDQINERIAEREAAQCTCRPRAVRPTDIDPPDIRRDRDCPLHGIDPDRARDERNGR